MRNILALIAAFTLSSSTAVSAVACGSDSGTTIKMFDWNKLINDTAGWNSNTLFKYLANNLSTGVGSTLYKNIVNYVSLSILKTDDTFKNDRIFAQTAVANDIENEIKSIKAKFGRSWESHWKDVLKDIKNGGNGKTGSYSRYFDSKLKDKATTIVTQHYVTTNYNNYKYYNFSEMQIWLQDLYNEVRVAHNESATEVKIKEYDTSGQFKGKVWILAKANHLGWTPTDTYQLLAQAIANADSYAEVSMLNPVPVVANNDPESTNYQVDTDSSNAINGLLSTQQANIARLWMKNTGPIWTRQIVVPFDSQVKDPLNNPISYSNDFKDSKKALTDILSDIKTSGFKVALRKASKAQIVHANKSSQTGDLGLSTSLNADGSNINGSFSYYVDRYVTSKQGIGDINPSVVPFNISKYSYNDADVEESLKQLIYSVDHQYNDRGTTTDVTTGSVLDQTSQYRDEVVMDDPANKEDENAYSGAEGNKVVIFIDSDGLHFVQTRGISYQPKLSPGSNSTIITGFNSKLKNRSAEKPITWDQAATVANRPGGLTNNPYLDYLQTSYLEQESNNTTDNEEGVFFNLNKSLNDFADNKDQSITSSNWWDYVLYFNNNIDKVNWNINSDTTLSNMLQDKITASNDVVSSFTTALKTWFTTTYQTRWNNFQGITSTDTLKTNINKVNSTLDSAETSTPARLDADDLIAYLTNIADISIWWYDSNSIKN